MSRWGEWLPASPFDRLVVGAVAKVSVAANGVRPTLLHPTWLRQDEISTLGKHSLWLAKAPSKRRQAGELPV
jgi:hypothetical protein